MRARFCPLLTTLGVLAGLIWGEPGALVRRAGAAEPGGRAASSVSTGVLVRCATEKAAIFIDGDQVGQTPLGEPIALKVGEHTIRVARLGFTPFIDVFKVRSGQVTKLEVEIIPISGVLRVSSAPEAAPTAPVPPPTAAAKDPPPHLATRVFVDDKYLGQPPLEVELTIGSHRVRIERGGYYPDNFTASAVAGQTIEHEVVLKPLPPELNPYLNKGPAPTKWYNKWWVWTLGAVGVAVVATAVIVPIVVTQQNSLCNNVDVCATASTMQLTEPGPGTAAASRPPGGLALTVRF
jgi:hypothetical protein